MTKVSNFIKEVTARLKGDEAGVVAAKVERKALSAINGSYVSNIQYAQGVLDAKTEELESTKESIAYFEALLANNF
jgi:hypothetical protein